MQYLEDHGGRVEPNQVYLSVAKRTDGGTRASDRQTAWHSRQRSFPPNSTAWRLLQFCHMYSATFLVSKSSPKASRRKTVAHARKAWNMFKAAFLRDLKAYVRTLPTDTDEGAKENRMPPA